MGAPSIAQIKDVNYIVSKGDIVIVDEFTGRTMPGRRWGEGLHQAIEAKEGLVVQNGLFSVCPRNSFYGSRPDHHPFHWETKSWRPGHNGGRFCAQNHATRAFSGGLMWTWDPIKNSLAQNSAVVKHKI